MVLVMVYIYHVLDFFLLVYIVVGVQMLRKHTNTSLDTVHDVNLQGVHVWCLIHTFRAAIIRQLVLSIFSSACRWRLGRIKHGCAWEVSFRRSKINRFLKSNLVNYRYYTDFERSDLPAEDGCGRGLKSSKCLCCISSIRALWVNHKQVTSAAASTTRYSKLM